MKKCKYLLLAAIMTMLMCGAASAADFETRGSAVVTGIQVASSSSSTAYTSSGIWVTNISGTDVTCKITAFNHYGDDISSYIDVLVGSATSTGSSTLGSGGGAFSLPANETRMVRIYDSGLNKSHYGYALIEWSSEDATVRKAIIAQGNRYTYMSGALQSSTLAVNSGQPF